MFTQIGSSTLELVVGDITLEKTDVIVTAANSSLAGGGGVDGAIHRAAGGTILQQLRENYPQGCPAGQAAVTDGGKLACRYLFHAVGPIWRGGRHQEKETLKSAYRACLQLAERLECHSIAFPAISTGAYGYPLDLATQAALGEICDWLKQHSRPSLVRCVLFNAGIYGAYCRALKGFEA